MRILHLTPELPHDAGGGAGRAHEYLLCRRLVELGHDVLNISPVLPSESHLARALAEVGVENWVALRPSSEVLEAIEGVAREPTLVARAAAAPVLSVEMQIFWTRLRNLAQRAVSDWRPDVVVVVHDMAAAWASWLTPGTPALLALHDLHWEWYRSRARNRRQPLAALLRAEAWRHRRQLLSLLPRYAAATAVSTTEAAQLRAAANIPVSVIPTGVDTARLRPVPERSGPPRLLFTGTMSYPPNTEGITWFAEHVWKAVREEMPEAQLDVVGRDADAVRGLKRFDGITVVGRVPEMGPYFARAHAVIVPILTGAGVRVKVVEGMAAGRPIVSTSVGFGGLPHVIGGRHLLVADDPRAFATEAVRLLRDPALRAELSAEARTTIERHYDWRTLGNALEAVLSSIAT